MATHSSVLAWRIPGMGSLVGCRLWGHTESDTTEATQQQQQVKGNIAVVKFSAIILQMKTLKLLIYNQLVAKLDLEFSVLGLFIISSKPNQTKRRKWQPTPVFLPGESQGRGSLVGCHLWGRTESDTTEVTQQLANQTKNILCFTQALLIAKNGDIGYLKEERIISILSTALRETGDPWNLNICIVI